MKDIGKQIADIVCEAWNTLDSSLFEAILSDDFEYISVWVLETMKGKGRYRNIIKSGWIPTRKNKHIGFQTYHVKASQNFILRMFTSTSLERNR